MSLNVELLRASFQAVTPHAEELMETFYSLLFSRYPAVVPLFSGVDMKQQRGKLLASLGLVVKNCDQPANLVEPLRVMGARHVSYGTRPEHYAAVGECLLAALAATAGPLWNKELEQAWSDAYQVVAGQMIEGARLACLPQGGG